MADDPTWYSGVVKAILPAKGFGFISCDESHAHYGADVYLHSTQLENLEVGMQISFQVKVNAKGNPQAVDVSPADMGGHGGGSPAMQAWKPEPPWAHGSKHARGKDRIAWEAPTPVAEPSVGDSWLQAILDGGVNHGVPLVLNEIVDWTGDLDGVVQAVTSWLAANSSYNSSYASAPAARKMQAPARSSPYGYRESSSYGPSRPGARHAGGPTPGARHATAQAPGTLEAALAAMPQVAENGEARFEGEVSAIKKQTPQGKPGFGFIRCPESKELFGDDVFLHSSQSDQLEVGQRVSFEVQMNKAGRPQAINVMLTQL